MARSADAAREADEMMRAESDPQMIAIAEEEHQAQLAAAEQEYGALRALLLTEDPNDERDVVVEIRAGTGGDEAALFAADLFRMYWRYAERMRWRIEVLDQNETAGHGFKEIVFEVHRRRVHAVEVQVGGAPGAACPGHRGAGTDSHIGRIRRRAPRGG